MKIIHYSNNPISSHGGIEHVVRYASALSRLNNIKSINKCINVGDNRINRRVDRVYQTSFKIKGNWVSLQYIFDAFKTNKRDTIVVHYPNFNAVLSGLIASHFARRTIVLCHSSCNHYGGLTSAVYKVLLKLYNRKSEFWTTSNTLAKTLRRLDGISVKKIQKITPFQKCASRKATARLDATWLGDIGAFDILVIGRLSSYKGRLNLNDVTNARVVICETNKPKRNVKKLNSNIVVLEGPLSETEKQYIIQKARLLCFYALNEGEGFGLLQLEASRLGIPVVNSYVRTGVIEAGLNEVNAITLSQKDFCLRSIQEILQDKERLKRISDNANSYYETYYNRNLIIKQLAENFE